jgi:hypothetical protein
MERFYRLAAVAAFWAGVFFTLMEVVYGYFFNVWSQIVGELVVKPQGSQITKAGEMALFGFLAFAFFAMSVAASRLTPRAG